MATTYANVPVNGLPFTINGNLKEVITDVTIADNSEVLPAASLGLNALFDVTATIQDGATNDTAIYVTATIASGNATVTVATFTADGSAATTAATTVIRVRARGW